MIAAGAFYGCTSLERISIPNSVRTIGYEAFARCTSLKSLMIPKSVKSIWDRAFEGCSSMKKIRIPKHFTDKQIETWRLPRNCEIERY